MEQEIDLRFRTQFNNVGREHDEEKVDPVTMTIPDLSLTIPEIMARYARGLPLGGVREGIFELHEDEDGEYSMPDVSHMDLAEIQQMKADADAEVERLKLELQDIKEGEDELKKQNALKVRRLSIGRELLGRAETELQDAEQHFLNPDLDSEDEKHNNPNPFEKPAAGVKKGLGRGKSL